jgi:hypothetical protein
MRATLNERQPMPELGEPLLVCEEDDQVLAFLAHGLDTTDGFKVLGFDSVDTQLEKQTWVKSRLAERGGGFRGAKAFEQGGSMPNRVGGSGALAATATGPACCDGL